jgi:2-keto-4-pentenoate hydratase
MPQAQSPQIQEAAERLRTAARTRTPCAPVRDLLPDATARTAYAVQDLLTRAAVAEGRRVVGRKVGLTSPAVRAQLGVDQPDFGVLFDDMAVANGAMIDPQRLLQPKVEAEIAFVLGADLDAADLDEDGVRAATDHVVAALEVVDSRIADWDITFADTVADNASSGLFVLGGQTHPLAGLDLTEVRVELLDAVGTVVSTGTGAASMGDPVRAVLWLARTCRELGAPLRAGEVVLSGALGPMVAAPEGSEFTATMSGLGTVSVGFAGERSTADPDHDRGPLVRR